MPIKRVKFTYEQEMIKEPIISILSKDFDLYLGKDFDLYLSAGAGAKEILKKCTKSMFRTMKIAETLIKHVVS